MKQNQMPDLKKAQKRTKEPTVIERAAMDLPAEYFALGNGKTYYIRTYGCQANFHDTEMMAGILEQIGFVSAPDIDKADLVLLNTCAIRENAEDKVFGEIGILKHDKEHGRNVMIGVGGCMMQQPSIVEKIRKTWPEVNFIFGTHNMVRLPYLVKEAMNAKKPYIEVFSEEGKIYENVPFKRKEEYKAYVSIMDGCDKFCTYCIVPFTRGKQRSRLPEDILCEVRKLKENGCKEVMLLGQNVNAYGKDFGDPDGFAGLLKKTAETGIERVRFMTSHPWDFTDAMIETIRDYPNIMPYFHLPVQSGSDEILRMMGRRYTAAEYLALFRKLKAVRPEASFSTDIIVGFPGETEEDFEKTLELYDACGFDSAFTFAYSPRKGTAAAKREDQIPEDVKSSRLARLNERVSYWGKKHNEEYIGKTVEVLAEGPSRKNGSIWSGYTGTMKLVNFEPHDVKAGDLVQVKILDAKSWTLDGKQV
ncbi:MAG: tRNA (N6-isopentenyl adenosine(37)-C2)-methylthiotransferase MiaB [Erysipelotrichales bacterium]|nr:tRNA (N6-isopentenyl adenosine(37)-C2)-methylthiotransferase MiaB [Erysipelotrichales bacterium]